MATVKNITSDVLSLFRAEAPPVQPGDEVTLRDETFVGRAWPKSTWEVVVPPEGYADASLDDAYLYVPAEESDERPAPRRTKKES